MRLSLLDIPFDFVDNENRHSIFEKVALTDSVVGLRVFCMKKNTAVVFFGIYLVH